MNVSILYSIENQFLALEIAETIYFVEFLYYHSSKVK